MNNALMLTQVWLHVFVTHNHQVHVFIHDHLHIHMET